MRIIFSILQIIIDVIVIVYILNEWKKRKKE